MKITIIVVCLNAGSKLKQTIDSIMRQSYEEFEIIVKDGMSTDASIENLQSDNRIKLIQKKDTGIYDAMNQALSYASGDFILFLNCGDVLYDGNVLTRVSEFAGKNSDSKLIYGNTYSEKMQTIIYSSPEITPFTCYRNIPCHQSCFYKRTLFTERQYDLQYQIRADYEHFLWCFFMAEANPVYDNIVISSYEGGGYSESKENEMRDKQEHKAIVTKYMGRGRVLFFETVMLLTLAPIRKKMAESALLSELYHKIKKIIYRRSNI